MASDKPAQGRWNALYIGRALMAVFALLVAAAHLAYTIPLSAASFPAPGSGTSHGGAISFNTFGFWFDVEVIADVLVAVVFLLGLRTWYPLSILFNAFNMGLYFVSGLVAIPFVTQNAFPGRFDLSLGISTINIIIIGWIVLLVLGLLLMKYDPGSELDGLLATRRKVRTG